MITYDSKSNIGFDLDVNIYPNDDFNEYSPQEIKTTLIKAFRKYLKKYKRTMKIFFVYALNIFLMNFKVIQVYADGDPLTVVNNLSTFVFSLIRAIGMIILGFGIVQLGLSLKSHDPSQRANGFLTVAGGIVITFAKEILNTITG